MRNYDKIQKLNKMRLVSSDSLIKLIVRRYAYSSKMETQRLREHLVGDIRSNLNNLQSDVVFALKDAATYSVKVKAILDGLKTKTVPSTLIPPFRVALGNISHRIEDFNYYVEKIHQQLKYKKNYLGEGLKITRLAEIGEDIRELIKIYPKVVYSKEETELAILTDDILCRHPSENREIDFGQFWVVIKFRETESGQYIPFRIYPASNNYCYESHYHPHLSTADDLCMGDGEQAIIARLREGRFCSFVDLVVSLLTTWGGHGYVGFGGWPSYQRQVVIKPKNVVKRKGQKAVKKVFGATASAT